MLPLKQEFANLNIGEPVRFRALTIAPLFRNTPRQAEPGYMLLQDAVARGLARVTELHEGASVPDLRFDNAAEIPVLLLDGEELVGAKQNRALNLTILAPPKSTLKIPVSCVEAGRWRLSSPAFEPADRVMYAAARAARAAQVTESMQQSGSPRSDQGAVWDEIRCKASRMLACSPTEAMAAVFERHAIGIEAYVSAFRWQPGQAGAVFAIAGKAVGLDLFDHPETMRRLFPKLLRSYALDALERDGEVSSVRDGAFARLLDRTAESTCFAQPAIGLGKDVRFHASRVAAAGLWVGDRYVHLCAFKSSPEANGGGPLTRMSSPRHRARF